MNFLNSITIGFKEIWAHKFRSLLTVLGIILGVASLVAMMPRTVSSERNLCAQISLRPMVMELRRFTGNKLQIPNPKSQTNSKFQTSTRRAQSPWLFGI